jgi:hypothetical protein
VIRTLSKSDELLIVMSASTMLSKLQMRRLCNVRFRRSLLAPSRPRWHALQAQYRKCEYKTTAVSAGHMLSQCPISTGSRVASRFYNRKYPEPLGDRSRLYEYETMTQDPRLRHWLIHPHFGYSTSIDDQHRQPCFNVRHHLLLHWWRRGNGCGRRQRCYNTSRGCYLQTRSE